MYQANISSTMAIESDSRYWNLIVKDQSGRTIESQNGEIISMQHSIETTSGDLTIGDLITQNVNIEIKRSAGSKISLEQGSRLRILYAFRNAAGYVPVGTYCLQNAVKDKDRIVITARDLYSSLHLDRKYETWIIYPAPLSLVLDEIISLMTDYRIPDIYKRYVPYEKLYIKKDDTLDQYDDVYDKAGSRLYVRKYAEESGDLIIDSPLPVNTVVEALNCCAAYAGCLLTQDRYGNLTCVRPSKIPYTVNTDRADDPQITERSVRIQRIECVVDNSTTLAAGASKGLTMTFQCPIMTQARLNAIAADWLGFTYSPAMIPHRLGDPRLDILDVVGYRSVFEGSTLFSTPIMMMDYSFDGGLSCNLQSTSNMEEYKWQT